MINPIRSSLSAFLFVLATTGTSLADYSVFRGDVGTGTCLVRDAKSAGPQYPEVLTTKPTVEQACSAAKSYKTDNAGEAKKCYTYVDDTVATCLLKGVTLKP
ncbi:MAG: hypothetical protein E5V75_05095 [Mesorhizobium sp.]|nr:MAG: hypothetical protein E5V75_05095 [Mesorhizobium sp.]